MKILGLIKAGSGPCFHRIFLPLNEAKGIDVRITNNCQGEEDLIGYDAIYYSREISDNILSLREKLGFKVILDVDDYWKLDPYHISAKEYARINYEAIQIRHIREADLVTTTHARLAEMIYPYNPNVIVTPNAIPDNEYFQIERTESERVRLFWQGGNTHEKDIELLRNPFKRLDKHKFFNVISGYQRSDLWDRMVSAYTNSLSLKGMILPIKSPFEYYKHYAVADIALIPLRASMFNSMKSNLKVLEAAHAGIPVIASHVDPYLDLPVRYVRSQRDWINEICRLSDRREREYLGAILKAFCKEHFNFNTINNYRMEKIQEVINKTVAA